MKLLDKFKARQRDMKTLTHLLDTSMARSAEHGEVLAGAHQLALSALEMTDGHAGHVLESLGSSADEFRSALHSLEANTLADLGLEAGAQIAPIPIPRGRVGKTDATFEAALRATYNFHNETDTYPALSSAHVLAGVASVGHGVAARVFRDMGLDRDAVVAACRARLTQ